MKKEEENLFKFIYVTEEDSKKELQEAITNLTEEQKSIFKFKGEYFYKIEHGHCFAFGFYIKYVTKTGIVATEYNKWWTIKGDDYEYKDDEFIIISKAETYPINWDKVISSLPIVKNINVRTIANDLESVIPN